MTSSAGGTSSRIRFVTLVTEVFSPVYLVTGLLLVVALHSASSTREAVVLGMVAAVFASLLPFVVLLRGVRSGRLNDRHLRLREQRPAMMVMALASVLIGSAVLVAWGAPQELLALLAAMVAGLVTTLAVTLVWKISIHAAVAAGTAAILVSVFGPAMLFATPLVALIAWSRIVLTHHTVPQVVVGAVVGAVIAAGVFQLLR
ncbi:MAG: phosphoesterase PA-phosphatase [Actinomycetota bacterium]|nr:phosphoesterase PA-phosphatase [Actinomycetota bacterium]